jgi:hypothetical protein
MIRIAEVEPLNGFRVKLHLTDGSDVERDLTPLLLEPLYAPLKGNLELFNSVSVENGTLSWPNGLDLDPDMVIWGGAPPVDAHRQIS